MINWFLFYFQSLTYILRIAFDWVSIFAINLPIVAASRIFYVLGYYLKYIKYNDKARNQEKYSFSKREILYFLAKNIFLIFIGALNILLASFIAIYSLLIAGNYVQDIAEELKNSALERAGRYIELYTPAIFAIPFIIIQDFFALVGIIGAYILYINYGKKYAVLTYDGLIQRYKNRKFLRIPLSFQILIVAVLVLPAIIFFILFSVYNFYMIDNTFMLLPFLFNPLLLLGLNLPIIVGARVYYYVALYLNFTSINSKRESLMKTIFKISRNKWIYLILINLAMLILGTLFIYFTIFFATYSFFMASRYYDNLQREKEGPIFKLFTYLSYLLPLMIFGLCLLFYFSIYSIVFFSISAGLAIIIFLKEKGSPLISSIKGMRNHFAQKFQRRYPNALQIFMIGWLIFTPIVYLYGITVLGSPHKETKMIEMRGGTKLSTNIYYSPLKWNPWTQKATEAPVILIRTPYNKEEIGMDLYADLYLSQGYHVVFQDIRNTYASEGDKKDLLFTRSYKDGVDTIEWILDKEWCNGKIGSVGASALSINTFMYAGMQEAYQGEDGLQSQTQMFGVADLYLDAIMEGAFRYDLVENWLRSTAPTNYRYQLDTIYDLIDTQDTSTETYLSTTLNAGVNNWSNVNVRALHIAGWYDAFLGGSLRAFKGYDDNGTERARDHQALIIGPWTHGAFYTTQQGSMNYPENSIAMGKIFDWEFEIFEEGLLGKETELWNNERVAYYVMGDPDDPDANYWKYADDWPLNSEENRWYFGNAKNSNEQILVDDGAELQTLQNFSYNYDPRDPCPTLGGNNLGGAGPRDQSLLLERNDTLKFATPELQKPYTIEGDMNVKLFFQSNCSDTDFMVRLVDIYPDGRHMLIIDGAKMASLRNGMYQRDLMDPTQSNKIYNMSISLFSTAYRFDKGHRIGLIISSSNFPRYGINPNTGGSITTHYSNGSIANNSIVTGPGKSYIAFPELK
ncbi:MAG: CocE/NonD family hydrolase [Promethearchaeia archaeon]